MPERISRRTAIVGGVTAAATATLAYLLGSRNNESPMPIDKNGILKKIENLNFTPRSFLAFNYLFRKGAWENAKHQQLIGTWEDSRGESDWINNPTVEEDIKLLSECGFESGRIAILSFEVTQDGKEYNWTPIETALDLMTKYNMSSDLCLGPLDYPESPGARLPLELEKLLRQEMEENGVKHINISLEDDPNLPKSSKAIREFAFDFIKKQLEQYGNDDRIGKFHISNEWPDTDNIEGIEGARMNISPEFILEITKIAKEITDKEIAFNTNIHPSDLGKLKRTFGPIMEVLGEQGVLGIDAYPTQEEKDLRLKGKISKYHEYIEAVRKAFPKTRITFTELQTEPWPPEGVAGKPWAEIMQNFPEVMINYYQKTYPKYIEEYMTNTKIKEIGSWGMHALLIAYKMGYTFPFEMIKKITEQMEKSR